jgi:predicted ATPase
VELVLTVLGAVALVVAIASNVTNVSNYLEARRVRRSGRDGVVAETSATWSPRPVEASQAVPAAPSATPPTGAPAAVTAPGRTAAASPLPALPPTRVPHDIGAVPPRPSIRTPDQRVRVFVSSTLAELAAERAAVREAVETLRLTPVMFEAGARAHPPRDLYRAYLDQSDVFVGIYAARYGWIAPGEDVSGLEDEYLRSGDRPKLIYVRRVEGEREPRLEGLLERVRADDRVSYRPFGDAAELRDLVADDLATLLSERFDRPATHLETSEPTPVPVVWGPLFGREAEVERACALLGDPQVRLVTLLGPGGIGKSRLALEVAHRLRATSGDGVVFVSLQGVTRPERVPTAIADALGLRGGDERDVSDMLEGYLASRRILLVVDNFEQVIEAAPLLSRLLEAAPGLKVLATSRTPLRLSAERGLPLGPLPVPDPPRKSAAESVVAARANPAVALFVWRAQATDPGLEVDAGNAGVLIELVRALDGWPLAILLAAARARHMSLGHLHERLVRRLDSRLDTLAGGARDMPDRQRTLRRTIAWSLEMLGGESRALLQRMSVFVGGATLEAIEDLAVGSHPAAGAAGPGSDVLDLLADLVDHSLVQRVAAPTGTRYLSFELVRAAAAEALAASGEADAMRARHAAYFERFACEHGTAVQWGRPQFLPLLRAEADNLRRAIATAVERADVARAARFARALWLFWWIDGQGEENLPWLDALLAQGVTAPQQRLDLLVGAAANALQLRDFVRAGPYLDEGEAIADTLGDRAALAIIFIGRAIVAGTRGDLAATRRHAERAEREGGEVDWAWAVTFAWVTLARVAIGEGDAEAALRWAEDAARQQAAAGDVQSESWARICLAVAHVMRDDPASAWRELRVALSNFDALAFHMAVVFALEVAAFVALRAGEEELALRLAAAAASGHDQFGSARFEPEATIARSATAHLRGEQMDAERESARREGLAMPLDVAVRYALGSSIR